MTLRIAAIQHEDDCPPAHVARWLGEVDAEVVVHRPYAGQDLPDPDAFDGLIVLGGEMGATDDADHAWLAPTRALLAAYAGPVLGICLGHQLAAVAHGGAVGRNPHGRTEGLVEVGWTEEAAGDPLLSTVAAEPLPGVAWNDDVVTRVPDGAQVLALGPHEQVLAVRFGPRAWGVQWHPEADEVIVGAWVADRLTGQVPPATRRHLDAIALAREELDRAWRPLAHRFAEICREAS